MSAARTLPLGARVAVLRFGALGDVIMAGAALVALLERRPDLKIVVLTKSAYAPLFAAIDGLEVWPLDTAHGTRALWRLGRRLSAWRPDAVYDLHGTLRAWALRVLLRGTPWRRVDKQMLARWLRLKHVPLKPSRHMVLRFGDVLGVRPEPGPWLKPQGVLRDARRLALVPGAAWATKQWPVTHWAQVARRWQARGGNVEWLGGESERDTIAALIAQVGGSAVVAQPLLAVAARLAGAAAVVAGDTGLGHLAAAVGTPVVSLFGPTVPAFGYTPWGEHRVVETDLGCRPCSLHGSEACPLGHHACMQTLSPSAVLAAVDAVMATYAAMRVRQ